jgi:hypothetical protein
MQRESRVSTSFGRRTEGFRQCSWALQLKSGTSRGQLAAWPAASSWRGARRRAAHSPHSRAWYIPLSLASLEVENRRAAPRPVEVRTGMLAAEKLVRPLLGSLRWPRGEVGEVGTNESDMLETDVDQDKDRESKPKRAGSRRTECLADPSFYLLARWRGERDYSPDWRRTCVPPPFHARNDQRRVGKVR